MKQKARITIFGITLLFAFQLVNATIEPAITSKPVIKDNKLTDPHPLNLRSEEVFLSLTPKKYTELTGKKMTLFQKVSLKIAQHKVRRLIKKGKTVDLNAFSKEVDTSNFNVGGFVLGLLLSIIGVIIAYLIGDGNVVKWAWIGFAIWVGIVLLILIL